jgi:hypothetical protein
MIVLDRKKPISALKLIHTTNHTQSNRFCNINNNHLDIIKPLDFKLGKRIYNLNAGLYSIVIDGVTYIIDVYFDLSNGDFFIIKNKDCITLYMAGSTPYPITPYKVNSIENNNTSLYNIESVNNHIDMIIVSGDTKYTGEPSLDNPATINRIPSININTEHGSESDSITIPFKHTLGSLPNGAKDYTVINTDQLITHNIINTDKEVLSGGLNWKYMEEYSDTNYYVFFTEYPNIKNSNNSESIRCSHFKSVPYNELINFNTKKNCIATSSDDNTNGIWIKIATSVLDIHGDKNIVDEMKRWIRIQAISINPIYIEYELTDTIYDTVLIDEYHVTTWYPNTKVTFNNNASIFYKALKSL